MKRGLTLLAALLLAPLAALHAEPLVVAFDRFHAARAAAERVKASSCQRGRGHPPQLPDFVKERQAR
jgi:hypothetical protein